MTDDEQRELDDRLDRMERYAEQDHEALAELRKEFDALKSEFAEFRAESQKTHRLLMWFTDMVKAFAFWGLHQDHKQAELCEIEAREQLEELKTRLRQ